MSLNKKLVIRDIKEFDTIKTFYQEEMRFAKYLAECYNKLYNKRKGTFEPFLICTFLEDKGIYQYTINESAVIQKSFERYNLLKTYLEKQEK